MTPKDAAAVLSISASDSSEEESYSTDASEDDDDDDDEESDEEASSSSSSDGHGRKHRKKKQQKKKKSAQKKKKKKKKKKAGHKHQHGSGKKGSSHHHHKPMDLDEEDRSLLELLREFIGFYNKGDDYTDSIVRDTIFKLGPDALDAPDENGNTVLLLSLLSSAFDLVPPLLLKGVSANATNRDGITPLQYCVYPDTYSSSAAFALLKAGAKPEVRDPVHGCTPLHWAASRGDADLCRELVRRGGDTTTRDKSGREPETYAEEGEAKEFLRGERRKKWKDSDAGSARKNMSPMGRGGGDEFRAEDWREARDEGSGHNYYVNVYTGESVWEADFLSMSSGARAVDVPLPASASAEDADADKRDVPGTPSSPFARPPALDVSTPNARRGGGKETPAKGGQAESGPRSVDKATFEERLVLMQQRMEEQLIAQLKNLEDKIGSPGGVIGGGKGGFENDRGGFVDDTTVELLRGEVAKKELEIIKLNRQILELQDELLAASVGGAGSRTPGSASQAAPSLEQEVAGSTQKVGQLEAALQSKIVALQRLEIENEDLKEKLGAGQRLLQVTERKLETEVEKIANLEGDLARERKGKQEAMELLEQQSSNSTEASKQVLAKLEESRKQDGEKLQRLEQELKSQGKKALEDSAELGRKVEVTEKELAEAKAKLLSLRDSAISTMSAHEEELNKAKQEHGKQLAIIKAELQQQQLLRLSQINELNEAKSAAANALAKELAMQRQLAENNERVKEAQMLLDNNDRLHKALAVETERRKALHNKLEDMKGRIRVYVRIRPLSSSEVGKSCQEVCKNEGSKTVVILADEENEKEAKSWDFDAVFAGEMKAGNSQENVFKDTSHLITSAVDGFNVCIFAYGQTGSGKTFTMFGAGGVGGGIQADGEGGYNIDPLTGLAPRAAAELFRVLEEKKASSTITVSATMFELYNDALVDLLAPKHAPDVKLEVKLAEHSSTGLVEVKGSVEESVDGVGGLLSLFQRGAAARTVASTKMNADSSRSHLITSIVTRVTNKRTGAVVSGKLTLVDLAGSERVGKSGATGDQLKEAQSINKSLSALGDVISALTSGSKHIPYRNHPLTMLMSDSIGGNAKTLMFVCCSPADYNRNESATSLDFAKRCKDVKNFAGAGAEAQAAQLKALRAELSKLKGKGGGGPPGGPPPIGAPPAGPPPSGPPPVRAPTGPIGGRRPGT